MDSDTLTKIEQDKIVQVERDSSIVRGQSPLYMFIFYTVSFLIMGAMIFQYINLKELTLDLDSSMEKVLAINEFLPYDVLIISLILYALGMFGIEGTRAVIMSFNITTYADKAKNMPAYKRNRLIQMIFVFIFISIVGIIFQMSCIDYLKANFHLDTLFTGLGVFITLLAYSDMGPKLGKEITKRVVEFEEKKMNHNNEEEETIISEK